MYAQQFPPNAVFDPIAVPAAKPGGPLSPSERIHAHRRLEKDYNQAFIIDHKGKDLAGMSPKSPLSPMSPGGRSRNPTVDEILNPTPDAFIDNDGDGVHDWLQEGQLGIRKREGFDTRTPMDKLWALLDFDNDGKLNLEEARFFIAMISSIDTGGLAERKPSDVTDAECRERINGQPPVEGMTREAFMNSVMPPEMTYNFSTMLRTWRGLS